MNSPSLDVPSGYQIHFHGRSTTRLLLPVEVVELLEIEDEVRAHAEASKKLFADVPEQPDALPDPEVSAEPFEGHPSIQVFDRDALKTQIDQVSTDKELKGAIRPTLESAAEHDGRRRLPTVSIADVSSRLKRLAIEMPNFKDAVCILSGEIALALAGPIAAFRLSPICLYGAPGIGKTRFASHLGDILTVALEKFSMGSVTANFELAGASRVWGTTGPGRISKILARNVDASPIVLLDEIDKISSDQRYPVTPVLLDLLEPDSAEHFRDECLELSMDASRIIFVATANDVDLISAPLQSRLRMIEVTAPNHEQRRHIAEFIAEEYELVGVRFPAAALDRLADANIDLRGIQRLMREAAGKVLIDGRHEVGQSDIELPVSTQQRKIGFV